MGLKDLKEWIFGTGVLPKNPKLHKSDSPTKHPGSKRRRHDKKIKAAQKRAKQSRKRNRRRK
jgi:hypothetical protein